MRTDINNDTICALATPPGVSAIAVIRLSGPGSIDIADKIFKPGDQGTSLTECPANTIHYGNIAEQGQVIDEVMVSIFRHPHSYTGEDTVEISCHGSTYIQEQLLQALIRTGARIADPGEFTRRAFLNGKMDLSRAEAVADLIASNSASSHRSAIQHIKGGFDRDIQELRMQLVNFASLIELELDFSEEDVAFANRGELSGLLATISSALGDLASSFSLGNAIRHGVSVVIAGAPNTGKSTLLNALLNEDRAIVSDIPGTTRDYLEDGVVLDGILFRFADTAGLREADHVIEKLGIEKTMEKMERAQFILYLFDVRRDSAAFVAEAMTGLKLHGRAHVIAVLNKVDLVPEEDLDKRYESIGNKVLISARSGKNIEALKKLLTELAGARELDSNHTVVTNARHYEALSKSLEAVKEVETGIENNIGTELLAQHIKSALQYLGEITGEVTNDEILGTIFSRFCIGK